MDNNLKEKAEFWMSELFDQQTRDNVRFMMENHPDELYECFYQDLEFGTGGLRGKMGVGTNRVNQYTIGMASQGLANYVKKHTPKEDWRVAIAYDSRNRSREFAEATAQVFLGNDFEVYLFKDLRPTPELSFAIRHYKCTTGIVITASHNPPEYNGYKVYWKDGGQVVSPQDSGIIDEVRLVNGPGDILSASNLDGCNMIGEETDALFIENSKKQLLRTEMDKSLKLVYTNLHGTGGQLIPNALRDLGYQVTEVQEQILPNGDFPTVESPNPEEASAMKMATDLANEISADVIIGTDPDADRVGIGIRTETGEIELLNGNQTGSMLAHYVLTTLKEKNSLPANGFVAKTIVTSDLIKEIADAFKVPCYETLTGFKYIAAVIRELPQMQFMVGGEESYGYMVSDFVRDKDAVTAAMVIAEMCAWAKSTYGTIGKYLQHIHETYGHYQEHLISVKKEGSEGKKAIAALMHGYRNEAPKELGGLTVKYINDFQSLQRKHADGKVERIDQLPSNVLQFRLDDGSLVTARPSGTEPKIKYYFSVKNSDESLNYEESSKALKEKIEALANDLIN